MVTLTFFLFLILTEVVQELVQQPFTYFREARDDLMVHGLNIPPKTQLHHLLRESSLS